jgi:hypothetical protein
MTVTYTNRKGRTYYLCQGVTKTGKTRYYFAREPKGEPVKKVPQGYEISESVNGVVSLAKARPTQILPQERAAVEVAVQEHPRSRNYRVSVKRDRIEVYEQAGPDVQDLLAALGQRGFGLSGLADQVHATLGQHAQFTPVLRFILADAETRAFCVQRMCYRSSVDGWLDIHTSGPLEQLARRLVPTLGTDRFFELY